MSSIDEFDYEYYESKKSVFKPSERHHIYMLRQRKEYLEKQSEKTMLKASRFNELKALEWVLGLIDEIEVSEE